AGVAAERAIDIRKNSVEVVRVALREYQGRRYLDIRLWYWSEDGPEETLRPSRKGVTLRVEQLPELRDALDTLGALDDSAREAA
ncbi:MAG: transcriptional coactivator p15/PC4 family protein, partial [Chloroflexota bacterium]